MKTLIIYYSYEGHTALIAETIAKTISADTLRLVPVHENVGTGFSKFLWGGKQVVMKERPKLQPFNINFDAYDQILIGSPVWAWTYTPAIRTFFAGNYLKGKKITFFCTHEGGIKGVEAKAKELIEKDNLWAGFKDFANVQLQKEKMVQEATNWAKDHFSK